MKKNIGYADVGIRIFLALAISFVSYIYRLTWGNWEWLFYIITILLLISVITRKSLLYEIIGIKTRKR